jgi:uncharacterized protein with PIN domain
VDDGAELRFFCDAMLGGLARWLRAAGWDASFDPFIDDGELVRRAHEDGRVLLSSDRPLFDRARVRDGEVRALFVPRHRPPVEQLAFVAGALALPVRDPRCMTCGGALAELPREAVLGEAPPRTLARCDRFWRCTRCRKLFWRGTHWDRISRALAGVGGAGALNAAPGGLS